MRKTKAKMRRAFKKVLIMGALVAALVVFRSISLVPTHFYYWFASVAVMGILCWVIFKNRSDKYINERGYIVLRRENELEHRYIAKQLIGRDLKHNEVVHHINGRKTDNEVRNLCLMDSEKHELFHTWLRWKKEKSGRYPNFSNQKRILENEYGGTLLENIMPLEPKVISQQIESTENSQKIPDDLEIFVVRRNKVTNKMFIEFDEEILISPDGKEVELDAKRFGEPEEASESDLSEKQIAACHNKSKNRASEFSENEKKSELQKELFIELRKERKRLADEKGVPAYIIFDNKTLTEISEIMPESESMMLQVRGIGSYKYQLYGSYFIAVVKKFKSECATGRRGKKDSA